MNWNKKKKREFNPKQEMGFAIGKMLEDCLFDLILENWLHKAQKKLEVDYNDLRFNLYKDITHSSRLDVKKGEIAPFDFIVCNKKVEVKSKRLTSYGPKLSPDNLLEEIKSLDRTLTHCQNHEDECIVIVGCYSQDVESLFYASHLMSCQKHKSVWSPHEMHFISKEFIKLYDEFYVYRFSHDRGIEQILKISSNWFSWLLPIWAAPSLYKPYGGIGNIEEVISNLVLLTKDSTDPKPVQEQLKLYCKQLAGFEFGEAESFKRFTPTEFVIIAILEGYKTNIFEIAKLLYQGDEDGVIFSEELYLASDFAAIAHSLEPDPDRFWTGTIRSILKDLKHPLGEFKSWDCLKALSLFNEYPMHDFGSYDDSFKEWRLLMEDNGECDDSPTTFKEWWNEISLDPKKFEKMPEAEIEERDVLIDELESQLAEHSELVKKYELDLRERDQMIDDLVSLLDSATSPEKFESVS